MSAQANLEGVSSAWARSTNAKALSKAQEAYRETLQRYAAAAPPARIVRPSKTADRAPAARAISATPAKRKHGQSTSKGANDGDPSSTYAEPPSAARPIAPMRIRTRSQSANAQASTLDEQEPKREDEEPLAFAVGERRSQSPEQRFDDPPCDIRMVIEPKKAKGWVAEEEKVEEQCVNGSACWIPLDRQKRHRNMRNTAITDVTVRPKYRSLVGRYSNFADLSDAIRERYGVQSSAQPTLAALAAISASADNGDTELLCFTEPGASIDASHLCGENMCFNPEHVVLERRDLNTNRDRCHGGELASRCAHEPRCLERVQPKRFAVSPSKPKLQKPELGSTSQTSQDGAASGREMPSPTPCPSQRLAVAAASSSTASAKSPIASVPPTPTEPTAARLASTPKKRALARGQPRAATPFSRETAPVEHAKTVRFARDIEMIGARSGDEAADGSPSSDEAQLAMLEAVLHCPDDDIFASATRIEDAYFEVATESAPRAPVLGQGVKPAVVDANVGAESVESVEAQLELATDETAVDATQTVEPAVEAIPLAEGVVASEGRRPWFFSRLFAAW